LYLSSCNYLHMGITRGLCEQYKGKKLSIFLSFQQQKGKRGGGGLVVLMTKQIGMVG